MPADNMPGKAKSSPTTTAMELQDKRTGFKKDCAPPIPPNPAPTLQPPPPWQVRGARSESSPSLSISSSATFERVVLPAAGAILAQTQLSDKEMTERFDKLKSKLADKRVKEAERLQHQ